MTTSSNGRVGTALALAAAVAVAAAWTGGPASAGGGGGGGDELLRAKSMVGVPVGLTGVPFRDREINGGGAPWIIDDADVKLSEDGELRVRVEGLTLLNGVNPATTFRAVLSCITVVGGVATNRNSISETFPATPTGDAEARVQVEVPDPCIAPIVFVTNAAGRWFAATGSGD